MTSEITRGTSENENTDLQQNMRERLQGVEEIIDSLLSRKPKKIPDIVNTKLRLPEDFRFPKKMVREDIDLQGNEAAFHKSLDEFMNVIKEEDMKGSLAALQKVLQNCVECHTRFKQ